MAGAIRRKAVPDLEVIKSVNACRDRSDHGEASQSQARWVTRGGTLLGDGMEKT